MTDFGLDFADQSLSERYRRLICVYVNKNQEPNTDSEWSHSLFNTANFDTSTFRQKMELFILAKHDYDSEPENVKASLIAHFGSADWKQKTSEYMSWFGLQGTQDFANWLLSSNIDYNIWNNVTSPFTVPFPTTNTNCN